MLFSEAVAQQGHVAGLRLRAFSVLITFPKQPLFNGRAPASQSAPFFPRDLARHGKRLADPSGGRGEEACGTCIFLRGARGWVAYSTNVVRGHSAISSTRTSVASIMARGTRKYWLFIFVGCHIELLERMKPTRIRMCHSLVMNYGLYKKMEIFVRVEADYASYRLILCREPNLPPNER